MHWSPYYQIEDKKDWPEATLKRIFLHCFDFPLVPV